MTLPDVRPKLGRQHLPFLPMRSWARFDDPDAAVRIYDGFVRACVHWRLPENGADAVPQGGPASADDPLDSRRGMHRGLEPAAGE
jgi:hypothetical protein